jgi:hypothetical protein
VDDYLFVAALDAKGNFLSVPLRLASSDTTVLRITPAGNGYGVKLGVVTLTATIDGVTASHPLRVVPPVYSVQPGNVTVLANGPAFHLQAQTPDPLPLPGAVLTTGITWTSSDPAVATVDAAGNVTALANGTLTITATGLGSSATATVNAVRYAPALRFVQAAQHSYGRCGLADDGRAFCWGSDRNTLRLVGSSPRAGTCREADLHGYFTYACSEVPLQVLSALRFTEIALGAQGLCGVDHDGGVWCANGAVSRRLDLPPLHGLSNTDGTLCGLGADGTAYCWPESGTPTAATASVAPGLALTTISAAGGTLCGTTQAGDAYCWGANGKGQLGTGDLVPRAAPTRVATDVAFKQIAVGIGRTCALNVAGNAYCWGDWQNNGSLPAPAPALLPVAAGGPAFARITAGSGISALTAAGALYTWNGTAPPSLFASPVPFTSLTSTFGGRIVTGSDGVPYEFSISGLKPSAPTGG